MKPCKKREETQLNALINEYEVNGDSENVARVKAENALLPLYRKELSKVLLEDLHLMRAMKKDPTFKKVMETQKHLKIQKDLIGRNRQNLLSINENSYSIECTKSSPFHKIKTRPMNVFFVGLYGDTATGNVTFWHCSESRLHYELFIVSSLNSLTDLPHDYFAGFFSSSHSWEHLNWNLFNVFNF